MGSNQVLIPTNRLLTFEEYDLEISASFGEVSYDLFERIVRVK
jgi:hypothetical protein